VLIENHAFHTGMAQWFMNQFTALLSKVNKSSISVFLHSPECNLQQFRSCHTSTWTVLAVDRERQLRGILETGKQCCEGQLFPAKPFPEQIRAFR